MDRTPQRTMRGGVTSAPQTPHRGLHSFMLPPGSPWAGGSSGSERSTPLRGAGGVGPSAASAEPAGSPRQAKRGDATPRAESYQHVLREIDDIKRRLDTFLELQVGGGGSGGGLAIPPSASLHVTPEPRRREVEASPSPGPPDLGAAGVAEGVDMASDHCQDLTSGPPLGEISAGEESGAQISGAEPEGVEEQAGPEAGPGALSCSEEEPAPPLPSANEGTAEPVASPSSWSSSSSSSGFARAVASWETERSFDHSENPAREAVSELDSQVLPEVTGGGSSLNFSRVPLAVEHSTAAVQTDFEGGAAPGVPSVSDAGTNTEPLPASASQASQAALVQEERLPPEGRAGRVPGARKVFAWQSRSISYDGAPATLFRETVVRVSDASTQPAEAAAANAAACQTEERPSAGVGGDGRAEEEEARDEDLAEGGWVEIEVVPALEAASEESEGTPAGGNGADDDGGDSDAAAALQALGVAVSLPPVPPPRPRLWVPERDGYFDDDECPPRGLGDLPADSAEAAPAPPAREAEGLPDDLKDPESLKLEVLWLLEALDRRRCHLRETLELAAAA